MSRRLRAVPAALITAMVLGAGMAACTTDALEIPACDSGRRLALLAQSVPTASYVPCLGALPPGWSYEAAEIGSDGARLVLESDRSDRPVDVRLTASCDLGEATPVAPSADGVRTYELIESIEPRYAGRRIDVFAGGCVVTSYDFERGLHVSLMSELDQIVGLEARREIRQAVRDDLGVELDP